MEAGQPKTGPADAASSPTGWSCRSRWASAYLLAVVAVMVIGVRRAFAFSLATLPGLWNWRPGASVVQLHREVTFAPMADRLTVLARDTCGCRFEETVIRDMSAEHKRQNFNLMVQAEMRDLASSWAGAFVRFRGSVVRCG